jgi:hypothetical protein
MESEYPNKRTDLTSHNIEDRNAQKDNSFKNIFKIASESKKDLKFLRLAGPGGAGSFRLEVMAAGNNEFNDSINLLKDKNINEIEFIFINPFSTSFLHRMDTEKKEIAEIWRIKDEIINFASKLLFYGQEKKNSNSGIIKVGFHIQPLIFNLGIVGEDYVVAGAYYKNLSGHDENIPDIVCKDGDADRLNEAFINYYNSIKDNFETKFYEYPLLLKDLGKWPSLFKANVIVKSDDQKNIEKACYTGFDAESCWIHEKYMTDFFKPVQERKIKSSKKPLFPSSVCISKIDGITGDEFLYHIQIMAQSKKDLIPKLQFLISEILHQSFSALVEFQKEGIKKFDLKIKPYPWEKKLHDALGEAGRYITDDKEVIHSCKAELSHLSAHFDNKLIMPFRDAHIKNRMIKIDNAWLTNDYNILSDFLASHEDTEIARWLKENTWDIDFETGLSKVTVWDDPMHIFYFERFGVPMDKLCTDFFSMVKHRYNKLDIKEFFKKDLTEHLTDEMMWTTLLSRSLREYCRRVWYHHDMPETYKKRYSYEYPRHFVDLSKFAINRLEHHDQYPNIKKFLTYCERYGAKLSDLGRSEDTEDTVQLKIPFDFSFEDRDNTIPNTHKNSEKFTPKPIGGKKGIRKLLEC